MRQIDGLFSQDHHEHYFYFYFYEYVIEKQMHTHTSSPHIYSQVTQAEERVVQQPELKTKKIKPRRSRGEFKICENYTIWRTKYARHQRTIFRFTSSTVSLTEMERGQSTKEKVIVR